MKINHKELGHVSTQWNSSFEGILLLKHKGDPKKKKSSATYSEHWCRLKGNILVLCRGSERSCTEIEGVILLERFTLSPTYQEGGLHAFRLDFDAGDAPLTFVARSEAEANVWRQHMNSANLSPTFHRIGQIRDELRSLTGSDPLDPKNSATGNTENVSPPEDVSPDSDRDGLELSIGCENLLPEMTSCNVRPNVQVVVSIHTSPETDWLRIGTTEVIENSLNPKFCKTILLRADRVREKSRLRFQIFDLRDLKSDLGIQIGSVATTVDRLSPGKASRFPICDPSSGSTVCSQSDELANTVLVVEVRKRNPTMESQTNKTDPRQLELEFVCDAILSKRYLFQNLRGERIHVIEFMGESKLCFDFSVEYLKSLIPREHLLYESLSRTGSCDPRLERLRKERLITMKQTLQQYEACLRHLVDCSGIRFKPSWERTNPRFDFVPTNLHVNQISITDEEGSVVSSHLITTVGAFAATSRSLKSGGLFKTASVTSKPTSHYPPSRLSLDSMCQSSPIAAAVCLLNTTPAGRAHELLYHGTGFLAALRRDLVGLVQRLTARDQSELLLGRIERMLSSMRTIFADALLKEVQVSQTVDDAFQALSKRLAELAALDKLENASPPRLPSHIVRRSPTARSFHSRAQLLDGIEKAGEQLTYTLDKAWDACAEILWNTLFTQFLSLLDNNSNSKSSSSSDTSSAQLMSEAERLFVGNVTSVNVDNALTALAVIFESFSYRHHAALCQALTSVLSALLAAIPHWNSAAWKQATICGILTQFECLLSCFGPELGMIEDWAWTVDYLTQVSIVLRPVGRHSESKESGTSTSPMARMIGLNECELDIPWSCWMCAPTELQSRGRVRLRIHPVAFVVGINEQQTIAESLDKTAVQLAINNHGLASLEAYFQRYTKHYGAPPTSPSGLDVCDLITNIRHVLTPPLPKKPVELLQSAAEITQTFGGLRLTSCKSAKDRTSMSVTLEQIRWLANSQGMHECDFLSALECIRRTGLRMDNVFKNTGGRKYAFNRLQLLSFPKLYRPPVGTYALGIAP